MLVFLFSVQQSVLSQSSPINIAGLFARYFEINADNCKTLKKNICKGCHLYILLKCLFLNAGDQLNGVLYIFKCSSSKLMKTDCHSVLMLIPLYLDITEV